MPVVRPERDEDAPLLWALFSAVHRPELALSGAPDALVDRLVAMQFRAQGEGYRVAFPQARRLVLERDGALVGRMVVAAEAADLYIVDIAVHPASRTCGMGGGGVAAVQREAAGAGLGVRALVFACNGPSMAMFRRRGFIETGQTAGPSLELRWTP